MKQYQFFAHFYMKNMYIIDELEYDFQSSILHASDISLSWYIFKLRY